jgi:hypothetical protein
MTPEFLKLDLTERQNQILEWSKLAITHSIKPLFWGPTLGVQEQAVIVFDTNGKSEMFFKFVRKWLMLGTPEAGKHLQNVRTVTVH